MISYKTKTIISARPNEGEGGLISFIKKQFCLGGGRAQRNGCPLVFYGLKTKYIDEILSPLTQP